MKYEGTRKSSHDNDVNVYIISLGLQELKLLRAIVFKAFLHTHRVLETTATCGRLRNFKKTLDSILNEK